VPCVLGFCLMCTRLTGSQVALFFFLVVVGVSRVVGFSLRFEVDAEFVVYVFDFGHFCVMLE